LEINGKAKRMVVAIRGNTMNSMISDPFGRSAAAERSQRNG
jgi:hypothetical protein